MPGGSRPLVHLLFLAEMNFVNPSILWALSALAIPVVVHLFNFRKAKKVFFPANRFLKMVLEESSNKRKILHWIALICRIMFLLFLVLAFAQPFIPAQQQSKSAGKVTIVLDNSPSMSVPLPDQTSAFDHALLYASTIIEKYPPDTRFKILTHDPYSATASYLPPSEAEEFLASVRLTSSTRDFGYFTKHIEVNQDVFFISDFQQSMLEGFKISDSLKTWKCIPIQAEEISNLYIDSVAFENPFILPGSTYQLTVWLRNDGSADAEQVNMKVSSNAKLASTASATIPAKSFAKVPFNLSSANRYLPIKIEVQDFPVSFDNEFYLTVEPLQAIRIAHILDKQPEPFFETVYRNPEIFEFRSFRSSAMEYSFLQLADLIIIDGLSDLPSGLKELLSSRKEKSFLIIPSEKPSNLFLNAFNGISIQLISDGIRQPIAPPDLRDPFFKDIFEGKTDLANMPSATPTVTWGNDRSAILKFRDGTPFLSRFGNLFLMATPLAARLTDFGKHALMVPVMYRLAASARRDLGKPFFYTDAQLILVPSDSTRSGKAVVLSGAKTFTPTQRTWSGKTGLGLEGLDPDPGIYAAKIDRDTLALVALNSRRKESKMELLTTEEIKNRLPGAEVVGLGSIQAFSNEIKERYLGVSLWKYCLALALLFLLGEIIVLRSDKPEAKRSEDNQDGQALKTA